MRFLSPEWFVIIPVIVFIGFYLRHLQLWKPLRISCIFLVIISLTDPELRLLKPGVDLLVLVDRSDSVKDFIEPKQDEWGRILKDSKSLNDSLRFIDFADLAMERGEGETAAYTAGSASTRMDVALRYASAISDPERVSRLLVLSDGYSTSPVRDLAEPFVKAGVSVYYRNVGEDLGHDLQVARFNLPARAQIGAPFFIEFELRGADDDLASYQLFRNDELIGSGQVQLESGRQWVRLSDRIRDPGAFKYTIRVASVRDKREGNNVSERWIAVESGPRILLMTAYVDDPLQAIMEAQGFDVSVVRDFSSLNSGSLSGVKAAILNNVPANEIPDGFLRELRSFVTVQGGGFAMLGGKYSFGSGGYYQSMIDDVLPVSMELREDQKRLSTAMAIVMDRSGSMAAAVSGTQSKMDLANAGAAGTVDLLGPTDSLTVIAVDSLAHEVVPMTVIGGDQSAIKSRIQRIESRGGGIFVYTGLQAAWQALRRVPVGQKHIILFSDSADSEEPGAYKKLLQEMTDEGATVSVIGLGTDSDADAAFLKDVAKRGNGRVFFNSNPAELPRLFAQETVAVARSAFIDEPTGVLSANGWLQIAAQSIEWPSQIDGYNLSYLKEGATVAASTDDGYNAPLIAFKRFGAGRSAAVTFPVSSANAKRVLSWAEFPDMMQTLIRWLVGESLPDGIALDVKMDGLQLSLDLLHDERHDLLISSHPPKILITDDIAEVPEELVWRRIRPGHFSAQTQIDFGRVYKGAVQLGEMTLPFGPLSTTENIEWIQSPERLRELKALVQATGGEQLIHLEDIWKADPSQRYTSIRRWILLLLLPLALVEFLITRMR